MLHKLLSAHVEAFTGTVFMHILSIGLERGDGNTQMWWGARLKCFLSHAINCKCANGEMRTYLPDVLSCSRRYKLR